jgi:hypothetical protein
MTEYSASSWLENPLPLRIPRALQWFFASLLFAFWDPKIQRDADQAPPEAQALVVTLP